ncbi:MAG: type IX secretion system membrane protein PorP/SprF, partial [Flavobacteriales bacterium]
MKKIVFLFVLNLVFIDVLGQDPTFTQFYANPVYLNPALAGS